MKRVLMIAYHFPPLAGSSGIQRTLRFVQHLPPLGWEPLVLSATPHAYEKTSDDLQADVPRGTVVRRAFALDTARHLNIRGQYFGWMARPDRWVSWKFDAIRQGCRLIKEFRPDVIWSTYPIATAHVIAAALHRHSRIPWVADFRDPMAQEDYPADPDIHQSYRRIESEAAALAAHCVFTTPGAATDYRRRYPAAASRMVVLENGYDEESFALASAALGHLSTFLRPPGKPQILLHSGIVYASERDPTHLFVALRCLLDAGQLTPSQLRIRFRASVHDELLRTLADTHGVQDFVELCPAISYRAALSEMMTVDALLVMQASNCNAQIPAKIYEYLRAGRPIIALTDPAGDTAGVMRGAGLNCIARLDSVREIVALLPRFLADARENRMQPPSVHAVRAASRLGRAQELARLLDETKLAD